MLAKIQEGRDEVGRRSWSVQVIVPGGVHKYVGRGIIGLAAAAPVAVACSDDTPEQLARISKSGKGQE